MPDTDATWIEFIRFGYDVDKAAEKIRATGLPASFADRLGRGYWELSCGETGIPNYCEQGHFVRIEVN